MKKIALFGNFGGGNLGNESTLQAILYHLSHHLPDAEVTCICTDPTATMRTHNIAAVPFGRIMAKQESRSRSPLANFFRKFINRTPRELSRWLEAFWILRGMDIFIVPGTGLLTDAYGIFGWGPYNLFKWCLLARLCGCKLLFICVGAGPIYRSFSKWLIVSALSFADFRSYRDISTVKFLQSIGFETKDDRVYPDLAFSLPQIVVPPDNGRNSQRLVVGIGLMDYAGKYSTDKPNDATYLSYLSNLAVFVRWLLAHEYEVRILVGEILWDNHVRQEFRGLLNECLLTHYETRVLDEPILSVEQLLSQIALTDLVVATRFHNVVLSLLLNRPTISVSFHHKCSSLMDRMGLSQYCNDINHLNSTQLIEQFCDLRKNAEKLKPMIRERVQELRRELEWQYSFIFERLLN